MYRISPSSLKDRKGMTLVEITITIGILGIVTLSLVSLLMYSTYATESLRDKSRTHQDYRYVATELTEQLRLAREVSSSYSSDRKVINADTLGVDSIDFSGSGNELTIEIQKDDKQSLMTLYLENVDDMNINSKALYYK